MYPHASKLAKQIVNSTALDDILMRQSIAAVDRDDLVDARQFLGPHIRDKYRLWELAGAEAIAVSSDVVTEVWKRLN